MTQTFNCPKCGGPLEFKGGSEPTIGCPFCHNTVIVPPELRGSAPAQGVSLADLATQSPKLADLARQIQRGNKLGAIKIYRQLYDADLNMAKEAIEILGTGGSIQLPPGQRQ